MTNPFIPGDVVFHFAFDNALLVIETRDSLTVCEDEDKKEHTVEYTALSFKPWVAPHHIRPPAVGWHVVQVKGKEWPVCIRVNEEEHDTVETEKEYIPIEDVTFLYGLGPELGEEFPYEEEQEQPADDEAGVSLARA